MNIYFENGKILTKNGEYIFDKDFFGKEVIKNKINLKFAEKEITIINIIPHENSFEKNDIRNLLSVMKTEDLNIISRARHMLEWDYSHKFCGICGKKLNEYNIKQNNKVCPECGYIHYPKMAPAIIVGITKGDKILLAHNVNFKNNVYSLIAGFVEPGEKLEETVRREVGEEVGIKVKNIKYFSSQPWPFPDSMMIGFTAEWESGDIKPDGVEIADAGWYEVSKLPNLPLNGSIARRIINFIFEGKMVGKNE